MWSVFGEGACSFKVSRGKTQEFKELESKWYSRLKEEGFHDIEDTRSHERPLLKWHSFYFVSSRSQERQASHFEYLTKAEDFYHSPRFPEACASLVKHGHSKLQRKQVETVFVLHLEGYSEREIAQEMGRSKTCIRELLERIRLWIYQT